MRFLRQKDRKNRKPYHYESLLFNILINQFPKTYKRIKDLEHIGSDKQKILSDPYEEIRKEYIVLFTDLAEKKFDISPQEYDKLKNINIRLGEIEKEAFEENKTINENVIKQVISNDYIDNLIEIWGGLIPEYQIEKLHTDIPSTTKNENKKGLPLLLQVILGLNRLYIYISNISIQSDKTNFWLDYIKIKGLVIRSINLVKRLSLITPHCYGNIKLTNEWLGELREKLVHYAATNSLNGFRPSTSNSACNNNLLLAIPFVVAPTQKNVNVNEYFLQSILAEAQNIKDIPEEDATLISFSLPYEILLEIFSYLSDETDIIALKRTCKLYNNLIKENRLLKTFNLIQIPKISFTVLLDEEFLSKIALHTCQIFQLYSVKYSIDPSQDPFYQLLIDKNKFNLSLDEENLQENSQELIKKIKPILENENLEEYPSHLTIKPEELLSERQLSKIYDHIKIAAAPPYLVCDSKLFLEKITIKETIGISMLLTFITSHFDISVPAKYWERLMRDCTRLNTKGGKSLAKCMFDTVENIQYKIHVSNCFNRSFV